MEAQAGMSGVLMRDTIIDTGRSSNLAENITPARYPLIRDKSRFMPV
jgi:hypothetical protein